MMVKKILICDDDSDIVEMLEMILEDTSYQVITEIDSRKVYHLIIEESPDVVLMDLWMPVISGDQILHQIRISPNLGHLPVIIMSASRDGKAIAMKAGADDYIAKPFDIDDLLHKLEKFG